MVEDDNVYLHIGMYTLVKYAYDDGYCACEFMGCVPTNSDIYFYFFILERMKKNIVNEVD